MNKGELIDAIADDLSVVSKKTIELVVTAAIEQIVLAVVKGDRVTLAGFGSFESRVRKERHGRNPRTGERMEIPARSVPVFKAGKTFKERAN
jgi:DNA-binding protein HU-beta